MTGNVDFYIINWFDSEQPPSNYVSLIQQFYNDLSGTQNGQMFYDLLNQYPDHTGSYPTGVILAGTWEDDSTPYPCDKGICELNTSAHEMFEAVTDPLTPTPYPSGWYNVGGGGSAGGGEIADLCGGQYGPTPYPYDNGKANQDWVSGSQDHYYLIQEMWSNSADACTTGNA
ncbi:MAG: hypothetical protein WCD86_07545 [Ktedonobacteraceae bacterium]